MRALILEKTSLSASANFSFRRGPGLGARHGVGERLAPHPDRPAEDLLPQRRVGGHLLVDPRVHLLVEARHRAHDVRAHLAHVLRHLLDALRVGDGDPAVEHEVVAGGALEAVAQRQEAQRRPLLVHHREELLRGEDVVEEVRVGEHDPLGVAGGARGVDEGGEVAARHLGGAAAHRLAVGGERLLALRTQLVERHRAGDGGGVEADDVLQEREVVAAPRRPSPPAPRSRRRPPSTPSRRGCTAPAARSGSRRSSRPPPPRTGWRGRRSPTPAGSRRGGRPCRPCRRRGPAGPSTSPRPRPAAPPSSPRARRRPS